MYLVKASGTASYPKRVNEVDVRNNWSENQIDVVDDELIQYYQYHSDVFTILGELVKWINPLSSCVITYNYDGTINTTIINGTTYTFTYLAGVLSTISDGVQTQTFTWENGAISSVTVA